MCVGLLGMLIQTGIDIIYVKGASTLMEASSASGSASVQNGTAGVAAGSGVTSAIGKRRPEERSAIDKRLRFSVRQTESAYRYRDIVVKKQDGFTHILFSTKTSENNSLNPDVSVNTLHAVSELRQKCQIRVSVEP